MGPRYRQLCSKVKAGGFCFTLEVTEYFIHQLSEAAVVSVGHFSQGSYSALTQWRDTHSDFSVAVLNPAALVTSCIHEV
jgi:hypothetical protein